jgi:hypothetical protein
MTLTENVMSELDRTTQYSSTGVGGSNNPAANPGQDKPAKREGDQTGQRRPEDVSSGEADQKGQRYPDKGGER